MSNITCVFGTKLPSNITSLSCTTSKGGLLDNLSSSVNVSTGKSKEGKGQDVEISLEATEQSGVQNR